MSDAPGNRGGGFTVYAVATLLAIGGGVVLTGGSAPVAIGMFAAWVLQLVAFRPLLSAMDEGRDMTRAWLGGLAIRAGGLVATGGATIVAGTSSDLPVAYGTTMMVLLMVEAGWLFRRLQRLPAVGDEAGREQGIERTSTTG